ncbi:NAD(P)-dependent oxidoreductase [Brevibacillus marinus]|uniref:NAD(P)-dependent oxidoreductase n=1 Tax=Brevibacillus marinus TaxID=2496837 RepID=UPI000F84E4D8|nr:DUF1932 domain-containing protein [Brevibacillus marinus]
MNAPRIGFIGFGEAAVHISKGLRSEGIETIFAYDVKADDPAVGPLIQERARSLEVVLTASLEELFQHSSVVFCATSAKYALEIAKTAAPRLGNVQLYVDLNAASPMTKKEIAYILENTAAFFVDAAVMDAVPPHLHKVPIWVSGNGAKLFQETMDRYGMNITWIGDEPGSSSACKMFRSIFMKGLTMLLFETLAAGHKFGVSELILDSLERTLRKPIHELADLLIARTAIHAERRVGEMAEVVETLGQMQLDATMSEATRSKLQQLAEAKLQEHFHYQAPERYTDVLAAWLQQTSGGEPGR